MEFGHVSQGVVGWRRSGGRSASPVSRALRLVLGVALGVTMALMLAAPAGASAAGQQWAMCSGGGHSYQARVLWNASGQVHAIEFRNATRRVDTLRVVETNTISGAIPWVEYPLGVDNRQAPFAVNSNYHRHNFNTVRPQWGWHNHHSNGRTFYNIRIDVYPNGSGASRACGIQFQAGNYDFTSVK